MINFSDLNEKNNKKLNYSPKIGEILFFVGK